MTNAHRKDRTGRTLVDWRPLKRRVLHVDPKAIVGIAQPLPFVARVARDRDGDRNAAGRRLRRHRGHECRAVRRWTIRSRAALGWRRRFGRRRFFCHARSGRSTAAECKLDVSFPGARRRLRNRAGLQRYGYEGYGIAHGAGAGYLDATHAARADLARTAQRRADTVESVRHGRCVRLHDARMERGTAVREQCHAVALLANVKRGELRLKNFHRAILAQREIERAQHFIERKIGFVAALVRCELALAAQSDRRRSGDRPNEKLTTVGSEVVISTYRSPGFHVSSAPVPRSSDWNPGSLTPIAIAPGCPWKHARSESSALDRAPSATHRQRPEPPATMPAS